MNAIMYSDIKRLQGYKILLLAMYSENTLTAKIFGENIFGEQMFGEFFIKSPKISVNNFGEKGF